MSAHDGLVVIERAPSTVLAEELQSLLAASGIDAFVDPWSAEEVVSGELYTEFTGVDVRVRPEDLDRARDILDEAHHAAGLEEDPGENTHIEFE
jgi:Putative prokaryotic signal transducing protein